MEFICKEPSKLLYLCVDQDMDMWRKGFVTLHDGEYLHYCKMSDLEPIHKRKTAMQFDCNKCKEAHERHDEIPDCEQCPNNSIRMADVIPQANVCMTKQ